MMADIPVIRGFMRMCNDGWQQGWHERNGGNLTYRMRPEEVEACRPFFTAPREWNEMGVAAENLGGEYFITTGSGKFLRNVKMPQMNGIEGAAKHPQTFPAHTCLAALGS